jgi:hypothetical protein
MSNYAAISVKQPWAWVLGLPLKDVENRAWALPDRFVDVPLWLHTGKRPDRPAFAALADHFGLHPPTDLPLGAIVGAVQFGHPVTQHDSPWFSGPVGWPSTRAALLPTPVPSKGKRGIWVPNEMRGRDAAAFLDEHGKKPTGGTTR